MNTQPTTKPFREPPSFLELNAYANSLVWPRPDEVAGMEQAAREQQFPIIGPACGNLCYLVARMLWARRIFELGSGYGYSTYWFARAVNENGGGTVHHTVREQELSDRARGHLTGVGLDHLVTFHVGDAIDALRKTGGEYDLIFCDIDKSDYLVALAEMDRHLRPGGVVIFDNMLLFGSVLPSRVNLEPPLTDDPIKSERREMHRRNRDGILQATEMLFKSGDWIASLVPLRDGLTIAMKHPVS